MTLYSGLAVKKDDQGEEQVDEVRLDDGVGIIQDEDRDHPEEQPGKLGGEAGFRLEGRHHKGGRAHRLGRTGRAGCRALGLLWFSVTGHLFSRGILVRRYYTLKSALWE